MNTSSLTRSFTTNCRSLLNGLSVSRFVPEPSTAMLLGLGLVGLCARRRRTSACKPSTLVAAVFAITLPLQVQAGSIVGLSDDFTGVGNPNTLNIDYNLAGRQSGIYATTGYTEDGNTQVGNSTLRTGGDGNYLLLAFNVHASPNQNFNQQTKGGLSFSFDVDPDNTVGSGNWTAFNLGMTQANRLTGVNGAAEHFGILFRGNGAIQAFDGNSDVTGGSILWSTTNQGGLDSFNGVRLEISDATDDDPFDGVGETTIDVYSDLIGGGATPIFSYTKTGGGYANNFVNFSSNNIGGIDNFVVTVSTPEPSTALMLGLGLIGLTVRRRRRLSNSTFAKCLLLTSIFAVATQANAATITVDRPGSINGVSLAQWNTDGNFEGWALAQISPSSVAGGLLSGTTTGNDSQISMGNFAGGPDLDTGLFNEIEIRIQRDGTTAGPIEMFWGTTDNPGFSGLRRIPIDPTVIPDDGQFHTYLIDMSAEAAWTGTLRDLRFDPYQGAGSTGFNFAFDYIDVGQFVAPEPSTALMLLLGLIGLAARRRRR